MTQRETTQPGQEDGQYHATSESRQPDLTDHGAFITWACDRHAFNLIEILVSSPLLPGGRKTPAP